MLGKYVRERGVITLEDAVRKMTSLPATAFRFHDRGLIRAGYAADIVLFDPIKVADRATFEKPHAYAEGFTHVFVNGQLVLERGSMTGKKPGVPVAGPGYRARPIREAASGEADLTRAPAQPGPRPLQRRDR